MIKISFFIFLLIAYLLGSIPSGIIIGKLFKNIDIREHGSKNTGATNAIRVLGKKLGITVLVLDMLKGIIPAMLADIVGEYKNSYLLIIGVMAVVGHMLSLFLKFKGGKGVATSFGVFLYLSPIPILICFIIFMITVFISKYVSLGSILAAVFFPFNLYFFPSNSSVSDKRSLLLIGTLLAIYVIYKHKTNIKRLLNGTENKFASKKS